MPLRSHSLNALRVFDCVMRTSSIKDAAAQLNLTPQAVSHQIRALETSIGKPLFVREVRRIVPTPVAEQLAKAVRRGFDAIEEGIRIASQADNDRAQLTLHVSPHFASHYLIPELPDFTARFPEADLKVSIGTDVPPFTERGIDAAILWGFGAWPELECVPLMPDRKVLVAQPALLQRKPIAEPTDLLAHTLLNPFVQNSLWTDAFSLLGLDGAQPQGTVTLHTNGATLEAVCAGLGVGLISRIDALPKIESKQLDTPFGMDFLDGLPNNRMPYYYLLHPVRNKSALLGAFQEWLCEVLGPRRRENEQALREGLPA